MYRLTLIGLLSAVCGSCAFAANWPDDDPNCSFLASGGQVLHGTLPRTGKTPLRLRIPKMYLPGPFYPPDGSLGNDGAVLVFAGIEHLQPYPTEKMHGKIAAGRQDWMQILISDSLDLRHVLDAQFAAFVRNAHVGTTQFQQTEFGLSRFNLSAVQSDRDIYIGSAENTLSDVLGCNKPPEKSSDGRYPQCAHYTEFGAGISTELSYSRNYLPEWGSIKSRAALFVKCIVEE